jgi:L-seryl-tRNA(Ser) seleniumtransferase
MSSITGATGLSRRRFLGWSQAALAALGAATPLVSTAQALVTTQNGDSADDYYEKLGVERIINAAGPATALSGAVMPAQVQRAVTRAALHPVVLNDLQKASGEYIARRLRCEGAMVTSGAAGALTLATAACVSAAKGIKPDQIPGEVLATSSEVIVQKAHRYEFEHAILLSGVRLVEVVTIEDYKRAFTSNTVMTNYYNAAEGGEIDRRAWLDIAHQHAIPCLMDAAGDLPPKENLWKYTGMGYDLVCFSGGKGIRGPQNAGLLLGLKHLTDLAAANGNPNSDAVGRGMKVAKEQIVGMVAALDWFLEQDDNADQAEYLRRVNIIIRAVKNVPTMKAEIYTPEFANHAPHALLTYDPRTVGITPSQVQEKLRALRPRIELNGMTGSAARFGPHSNENTLVVSTWMMQPRDAEIVGHRLHEVLSQSKI